MLFEVTRKIQFNIYYEFLEQVCESAGLAQSVERKALNLVVGGSSPPAGARFLLHTFKKVKLHTKIGCRCELSLKH